MTITSLDPNTALIVVDLQKGLLAYPTTQPIGDIIGRASALADAFRRHGLPVVLVNVAGGAPGRTEQVRPRGEFPAGWTDLVPELNQAPQDHLVTKRTWGAFAHTGLEAHLKTLGVTEVVIAGVSTSVGVESTAREAYACGFNVALAVDAMTDTSAEAHLNSVTRIFPKLGETGATEEIIALLDRIGT
jgi:nicotinamidase-related amidase